MLISRQYEEIITYNKKERKAATRKMEKTGAHRLYCLQNCQMPIINYRRTKVESEHCQNVNYQVSTGLCWRQGAEVGENRGNRVDKQLQTNNTTKQSVITNKGFAIWANDD